MRNAITFGNQPNITVTQVLQLISIVHKSGTGVETECLQRYAGHSREAARCVSLIQVLLFGHFQQTVEFYPNPSVHWFQLRRSHLLHTLLLYAAQKRHLKH